LAVGERGAGGDPVASRLGGAFERESCGFDPMLQFAHQPGTGPARRDRFEKFERDAARPL
jgi:hypothetical protein